MADVTDKDREAAKSARYTLHGEESESVLDCETGIIVGAVDRASAELMRDQLNSYEERLASERAAHEATKAEVGRLMVALYGDGSSVPGVEDELTALKARLALAEAWAAFGSDTFDAFWSDGEPSDVDSLDTQECALRLGILERRSEKHAGYSCCPWCEWSEGKPFDECECLFPVLAAWRAAK